MNCTFPSGYVNTMSSAKSMKAKTANAGQARPQGYSILTYDAGKRPLLPSTMPVHLRMRDARGE